MVAPARWKRWSAKMGRIKTIRAIFSNRIWHEQCLWIWWEKKLTELCLTDKSRMTFMSTVIALALKNRTLSPGVVGFFNRSLKSLRPSQKKIEMLNSPLKCMISVYEKYRHNLVILNFNKDCAHWVWCQALIRRHYQLSNGKSSSRHTLHFEELYNYISMK